MAMGAASRGDRVTKIQLFAYLKRYTAGSPSTRNNFLQTAMRLKLNGFKRSV